MPEPPTVGMRAVLVIEQQILDRNMERHGDDRRSLDGVATPGDDSVGLDQTRRKHGQQ